MSAIKNGIKELHCKESLSGKRFKRSIAHNNLKLTCNIYHIQVFKLPFPPGRSTFRAPPQTAGTGARVSYDSVFREGCSKSCKLPDQRSSLISPSCASCRGLRVGEGSGGCMCVCVLEGQHARAGEGGV